MTFLLLSMVLVIATVSVVRPAMGDQTPIPLIGFSGSHMVVMLAVLTAVSLTLGVVSAGALLSAHLLHEWGVVLGHRVAGHREVRFRLLSMLHPAPVSPRPHDTDGTAFFAALMGPGLSLAPMVAAFALSDLFAGTPAQHIFGTVALTLGAYNFVALLPIWPLPGGKMVRLLVRARVPRVSPLPAATFLAGAIGLSWTLEAPLLFLVSLIAALAYVMQPSTPPDRPALDGRAWRTAGVAYLFMISAFFLGGWWVLLLVTGRF